MRRNMALACGALAAAALAAAAQLPQPLPAVAPQVVQQDHYPEHNPRFPNGVRGVPSLVYSTPAGHPPLTLDLYLPPAAARKPAHGFPLVLYLHGDDSASGDPRHLGAFVDFPAVLAALAARGYVVASVDYRPSSAAIFPAQIQDVKAALKFLRQHAADYALDPAHAIAWGVSSGAHLAALAAVSCGEPRQADANPTTAAPTDTSDCVQGSIAWSGVFDMATLQAQARQDGATGDQPDAPEWRLLGCFAAQCSEGQLAAASPVSYVTAQTPPMLLIIGEQDKTVPGQQALEMAETLRQAGVDHDLVVIPGAGHDLIANTPAETRDANLAALQATFQFIDKTLHPAP